MLKKDRRLVSNYEYGKVRRFGKKYVFETFTLYALRVLNYEGPSKFGIVVTNRFSKNATTRNRIKRVYREIVRQNLDKIPEGYWIVIYPSLRSLEKSYEKLSSDYIEAIQKVFISG